MTRSLVEIEHGWTPGGGDELREWALKIRRFVESRNPADLPAGFRVLERPPEIARHLEHIRGD